MATPATPAPSRAPSPPVSDDDRDAALMHPDLRDMSREHLYGRLVATLAGGVDAAARLIEYEMCGRPGFSERFYIARAIERIWDDKR